MQFAKFSALALLIGMFTILSTNSASAELVTNGTFDTDLSGWDTTGTTTGVTWVSGAAHVGQTGTPGVAVFSQSFDVTGINDLLVKFDYEWQLTQPNLVDTFSVEFDYMSSTLGAQTVSVFAQGSDLGVFNSVTPVSESLNLVNATGNGTLRFTLDENNSPQGTRIRLDNVSAVPEPTSLAMFSMLGLGFCRRRRK